MNWNHLKTLVWLRWRLSRNQWKKAGPFNAIFGAIVIGVALVGSVVAFFAALIGGLIALPQAKPDHILLLWAGVAGAFLLLWIIGLVTDLQRSELLSLQRLLHMPLSLREAFLLNYLTSLASLSIVMFLPGMIGLSIAMTVTRSWAMLLMFPLVLGFLALVTAVTYQLRGWLATLMANKRRRRTIVALITAGFILLAQAPNLINVTLHRYHREANAEHTRSLEELGRQLATGGLNSDDYTKRMEQLNAERNASRKQQSESRYQRVVDNVSLVALVLPVGWLPYGAHAVSAGDPLPAFLSAMGMLLLAAVSLRWSYRAMMRFYTGDQRARKVRRSTPQERSTKVDNASFLERKLPGVSERTSTIALASFRGLLRAPEAKMALLTPIIMVGVFGSMIFLSAGEALPEVGRPFLAIGAIGMTMFGLSQLTVNIFGFDRHGFRAYVLMPVPRRDILFGKNLAVLPFAVCMCLVMLIAVQVLAPLAPSHFVANLLQILPVFLWGCLVGNTVSIYSPVALAAGAAKPAQPSLHKMAVQFFAVMLMPIALLPALASLGCELLLQWSLGYSVVPIYLFVSIVEVAAAIWLYRTILHAQGRWLQQRETRILETVAAAIE